MSFNYYQPHTGRGTPHVFNIRDESIFNNRAIHGDTVTVHDNEVTGIIKRSDAVIACVLQLTHLTKFGKTARGVPIYRALPLSYYYPEFRVASNMRGDKDIYVTIRFKGWEQNQLHPTGEIVTVIGDYDSVVAEETALKFKNGIYRKSFKTDFMPVFPDEQNRIVYNEDIITIDPKGSTDLDDAFHVDSDGTVYVHIVDLDYYMPETHPLNRVVCERGLTIYGSTVDHMLPSHWIPYITLDGSERKATVTIIFNRNTGMPESRHLSFIYPKRRLSYETAQELLDIAGSDMSLEIVAAKMGTRDAHKIVEQLMIRTNGSIGELLSDRPEGCIIRSMREGTLCAEYIHADDTTEESALFHAGLNLSRYTHFTSPMRRVIDLHVLRDLKAALFGFNDPVSRPNLQAINEFTRKVNRFYRDLDLMKFCNDHKDGVHTVMAKFIGNDDTAGIFQLESGLKLRLKIDTTGFIIDQPVELTLIVDRREIRLGRRLRGKGAPVSP